MTRIRRKASDLVVWKKHILWRYLNYGKKNSNIHPSNYSPELRLRSTITTGHEGEE